MKNMWVDVCSIAIYSLIVWGKTCSKCEEALSTKLINFLMKGDSIKPGSDIYDDSKLFKNPTEVLISILRQNYIDDGYRNTLDRIVERISVLREISAISGRIYSSWGGADLNSVRDGQLFLLCLLVRPGWDPLDGLESIIRGWAVTNVKALRAMQEDMKQWIELLSSPDYLNYKKMFMCIDERQNNNFESSIAIVKTAIEKIVSLSKDTHQQQLSQTIVSSARLADVAKWASSNGFTKQNGRVPLCLFNNISYSEIKLDVKKLIFRDMNKGEFTEPPMAQIPVNQDKFFAETVENYVAAHLMQGLIKLSDPIIVDATSAANYWEQLKLASSKIRKAGFAPFLFVGNIGSPAWIRDWIIAEYDESKRPADLRLLRDKAYENNRNYLGNFNDIAVFHASLPPGISYVINGESFEEVKFTEYRDKVYVEVTFEEHAEKQGLIDLILSWAFEIKLKEVTAFKLVYSRK